MSAEVHLGHARPRGGKAELLAEHLDLRGRKQLYDAGGGSGVFSAALVRHNPGLRATVFDVPTTLPITRAVGEASNMGDRFTLQAGNYHELATASVSC